MNTINPDSTGGTSRGSGISPVVSFPAFAEQLNRAGVGVCDLTLARYLFRTVGPRRLAPYVSFVSASPVPASVKNVQAVYDVFMLDRSLRCVMLRAIDVVETHLKAQCIMAFVEELGEGALSDASNFKRLSDYRKTMYLMEREAARASQGSTACPVAGSGSLRVSAAIDATTFGSISRLLGNVRSAEVMHAIAGSFSTNRRCLISWLRTTSLARNSFAHFEPYVVRKQIPSVPKAVRGIGYDNAAPLYILFVVERLLEGMAARGGMQEEADLQSYKGALGQALGSFAWEHPTLANLLRIPYEFVCGYAEPLLPVIEVQRGDDSTRYLAVAA